MQYVFKTIYFPRTRVRKGQPTRLTISLPSLDGPADPPGFASFVAELSSSELRQALGNPYLEDLEALAVGDDRTVSKVCLRLLKKAYAEEPQPLDGMPTPTASISATKSGKPGVTFQESKRLPIHGWYPYVEGFSAPYVHQLFERFGKPSSVYDPFGGAGTTQLAASSYLIPSWYSEVNPFMAFVADTKVQASRDARQNPDKTHALLSDYASRLNDELDQWAATVDLSAYEYAFPGRDFFQEQHIRELLGALALADHVAAGHPAVHAILRLACAANAVHSSNMTRRADLRRRRSDEYKTRVVDVRAFIGATVNRISEDLRLHPADAAPTTFVSADCRQAPSQYDSQFDLAITSPPYLNGTNYFRNTKIELWLLGFIQSEVELTDFRAKAIAGGINNVTKGRAIPHRFPEVEKVAAELDECATDQRIPSLVRHYFSDMSEVLASVHRVLRPGGRFIFDIGDSKFYGVHVPTDRLIESIAASKGLDVESSALLARRYSRDKSELVQRELVFRKEI